MRGLWLVHFLIYVDYCNMLLLSAKCREVVVKNVVVCLVYYFKHRLWLLTEAPLLSLSLEWLGAPVIFLQMTVWLNDRMLHKTWPAEGSVCLHISLSESERLLSVHVWYNPSQCIHNSDPFMYSFVLCPAPCINRITTLRVNSRLIITDHT